MYVSYTLYKQYLFVWKWFINIKTDILKKDIGGVIKHEKPTTV